LLKKQNFSLIKIKITKEQKMIKLYPHQKLATKFAINNDFVFIEAPTGSGKSIMISYLAHYYRNKKKKVIVSTHTNQLALELLYAIKNNEIKGVKVKKENIDIVVGKNNYLDISLFVSNPK
jgi:Rad3-related DNA helicase